MAARKQVHLFWYVLLHARWELGQGSSPLQRGLLPGSLPQPPEAPTGYQGTPAIYALVPRLPQPPQAIPTAVDQSA